MHSTLPEAQEESEKIRPPNRREEKMKNFRKLSFAIVIFLAIGLSGCKHNVAENEESQEIPSERQQKINQYGEICLNYTPESRKNLTDYTEFRNISLPLCIQREFHHQEILEVLRNNTSNKNEN